MGGTADEREEHMSRDSDRDAMANALEKAMAGLGPTNYVWAQIAIACVERLAGALERPRKLPEGTAGVWDLDERGDHDGPSLG